MSHQDDETLGHSEVSSETYPQIKFEAESKEIEDPQVTSDSEEYLSAARVRIYRPKSKAIEQTDSHVERKVQMKTGQTQVKGNDRNRTFTDNVDGESVCDGNAEKCGVPSKQTNDAVKVEATKENEFKVIKTVTKTEANKACTEDRKDQLNSDVENSIKTEIQKRRFKFVRKQDRKVMQKFIDNSPDKIYASQLCPSVEMESLSPELRKRIDKTSNKGSASQPSMGSRLSRKKLDNDFNATCPVKRKETETRTKLSLKRRKQDEDYRRVDNVHPTQNATKRSLVSA